MGYKVGPGLREFRLLASSGRGARFTQPRDHSLADPCKVNKWFIDRVSTCQAYKMHE